MTPIEEFRWCLSILRKLYKGASQDIFNAKERNGLGFYIIFSLWLFAILCFVAAALDDQFDILTRLSCAAGSIGAIQILIKYYFLRDLRHLLPIIEFIADIYEKDSQPTSPYYRICKKMARISKLTIKVGLAIYFSSISLAALAGTIETMFTGVYRPTVLIYFPGVHEYSNEMLVLSAIFNHMMVVFDTLQCPAADMFFFILFANMPMVPLIIKAQLDELAEVLEQKQILVNAIDIKRRIVQIIEMQRRYNDNVILLGKHFFKFCILIFVTANIFSAVGVFLVVKENMLIAYGIGGIGIFQITTYCILGTIIENSSDRVYDAVCAFNWYTLPHNEQKNYLLLLHYAQQPQGLYIGGIQPLNMETCVSTIKGIYSYAMVLKSTME